MDLTPFPSQGLPLPQLWETGAMSLPTDEEVEPVGLSCSPCNALSPAAQDSRSDGWLSRESGEKPHRLRLPSRISGASDSLSEETQGSLDPLSL